MQKLKVLNNPPFLDILYYGEKTLRLSKNSKFHTLNTLLPPKCPSKKRIPQKYHHHFRNTAYQPRYFSSTADVQKVPTYKAKNYQQSQN